MVGLNHCPKFLYPDSRENRIEDLVRHLLHIRNVGGLEAAALAVTLTVSAESWP